MDRVKSFQQICDTYGLNSLVPITNLRQILFYTAGDKSVQPKWVEESTKRNGNICCWFDKSESFEKYQQWMKNCPSNGDIK